MKDAVIVSTARTPIAKAYRGGFNDLHSATLGAHAVSAVSYTHLTLPTILRV